MLDCSLDHKFFAEEFFQEWDLLCATKDCSGSFFVQVYVFLCKVGVMH